MGRAALTSLLLTLPGVVFLGLTSARKIIYSVLFFPVKYCFTIVVLIVLNADEGIQDFLFRHWRLLVLSHWTTHETRHYASEYPLLFSTPSPQEPSTNVPTSYHLPDTTVFLSKKQFCHVRKRMRLLRSDHRQEGASEEKRSEYPLLHGPLEWIKVP